MGLTGAGEGNRTLILSLEGFCSTIELHPQVLPATNKNGGGSRIRTYEGLSQQIYSLPPLATWVSHQRKRTNNYEADFCCCQDNCLLFCKKVTQKDCPFGFCLDYRSKEKILA